MLGTSVIAVAVKVMVATTTSMRRNKFYWGQGKGGVGSS